MELKTGSLSGNYTAQTPLLGNIFLDPAPLGGLFSGSLWKTNSYNSRRAAASSHEFREPAALAFAQVLKCSGSVVDIAWLLSLRGVASQRAES